MGEADRTELTLHDSCPVQLVSLNGRRVEVRRCDGTIGYVRALTGLLHSAYKPLADRGLRFVASHQDEAATAEQLGNGICFIAQSEQALVGTIFYYTAHIPNAPKIYQEQDVAVFGKFAVLPAWQRHGLGSYLLSFVESYARGRGKRRIALDTSEQATQLIAFYRRRGYEIVAKWDWSVTNYTSVVMTKSL